MLLTAVMFAQNGTIKGKIIDKQSDIPLIGASVEILGSDPHRSDCRL